MKTFQRILAVVLCLVMSLSILGTVAFAEQTTTGEVIDTNKRGSLTIHKYEYNRPQGEAATNGTGSENDTVPENAAPLDNVTFKITKVYTLDSYYGTEGYTLPTVAQAQAIVAANDAKDAEDPTKLYTITDTTGTTAAGVVEFKDLELGLYLVQEISAPAQITGKTPDFLVSIPMTTTDGDNWLYDVHVFPKNSSTYAGVTLQKKGQIGNNAASTLEGATFVLQEKGTNNNWTTVTENNKGVAIGTNGTLTTGSEGKITVSDLAPGEYRFVETGTVNGYIMDGATTYEFTIADGTDTYVDKENKAYAAGTVLIDGESVDTNQTPITVTNYQPDMDKEVKNGNTYEEAADYSVGDNVEYKVTVDVPANIKDLKTFTLTDTLTNQKFNDDVAIVDLTKNVDYTVKTEADGKFVITFDTSKLTPSSTLTITYSAELLSSAFTTVDGNPNSAVLTYDSKILPDTDDGNPNKPGDPGKKTIKDETVVYTFKLTINKTGENGAKLSGVKFDLYKEVASGTDGSITGDAAKAVGLDSQKSWVKVAADLTTNGDGVVSQPGLANGTYYLVETQTNAGYNLLKAPAEVTLNIEYEKTWKENTEWDSNGNLIKHDVTKKNEYFGGSEGSVGNNFVSTNIVNKKGFTLPQTGGIGTLMFFIIGGVLIAGGICLITVPNKKRSV